MARSKLIIEAQPPPERAPVRVGIVIQARMGSKRFPGKVLAPLGGKPVLQHVIERCKEIRVADNCEKDIIVAAPNTDDNEVLLEFADEQGVNVYAGDERNVLERYYHAAQAFKLNVIMRITADCPFINPKICEELLNVLAVTQVDYVSNIHPIRTYPKGLDCEIFTYECLEATYAVVMEKYNVYKPHERRNELPPGTWKDILYCMEHVTPFMQREPGIKTALLRQKKNMSHHNLCVDYPKDLKRLEKHLVKTILH